MDYGQFQLEIEEGKQLVKQKWKDSLPPHQYDPRIKDFLPNTWNNRVNEFALPHTESEELPNKIQKIPQPVLA
jgi:hypothetical protein